MSSFNFNGVITALVTPFVNGNVDLVSFEKLIKYQLDSGIEGFVINGTTGESPTLRKEEVIEIFNCAKKIVTNKVPLILGTGSNSTEKTIEMTKLANELGADAALVVVPYYNKPPQRGMFEHFKAVAESTSTPVLLYNVPSRTVASLNVETVNNLSQQGNIIGIKEASGDLEVAKKLKQSCDSDFILSSGDDGSCLEFMKLGGHGVISVISHVIPKETVALAKQAMENKELEAEKLKLFNAVNEAIAVDTNPIPVKAALYCMGIISSPELRLPLVQIEEEKLKVLKAQLKESGII